MKTFLRTSFLLLLLMAVTAAALFIDLRRQLEQPLALDQTLQIDIAPGQRLREVLLVMREQDAFSDWRQAPYLEFHARLGGEAAQIKAGTYELQPGLTPLALLQQWVEGRVLQFQLQVIEGSNFSQLMMQIAAHPEIRQTLVDPRVGAVMKMLGEPDLHPEGRFFPDTYLFPKGTTDVAFLRRALTAMQVRLDAAWATRAAELPYASADDALVMASIIEKETGLASEREQIAGVFVRRLRLGMLLQTDPTVIYGLGEAFDGNLRRRDLLADSPYNSYQRAGLPPTPICLPGAAAIHAALHPAAGEALFFVARGDGSHQFSATLEAHNAAVRRYQLKQTT